MTDTPFILGVSPKFVCHVLRFSLKILYEYGLRSHYWDFIVKCYMLVVEVPCCGKAV